MNYPGEARLHLVTKYLGFLKDCGSFSYQEFISSPKVFGAAVRSIQLISKYLIDISTQLAFERKLAWQGYPGLYNVLAEQGLLSAKLVSALVILSNYYLEPTLKQIKLAEVFKLIPEIKDIVAEFKLAVEKA